MITPFLHVTVRVRCWDNLSAVLNGLICAQKYEFQKLDNQVSMLYFAMFEVYLSTENFELRLWYLVTSRLFYVLASGCVIPAFSVTFI